MRPGCAAMPLVLEALFARTERPACSWEDGLGLGVTPNRLHKFGGIAQSTPASHRFVSAPGRDAVKFCRQSRESPAELSETPLL
jgi:hypothetical protein